MSQVKTTLVQAVTYCIAHVKLEDVVLDNDRGEVAADLYIALLPKAQALQLRQKALRKERAKILDDHAQKDAKGFVVYQNPTEPDATKKLVSWKDQKAAMAALAAWDTKAEQLDETDVVVEAVPLPDDFFTKPTKLTVEQSVRTAFLPFMVKHQPSAAPNKAKPKKRKGA